MIITVGIMITTINKKFKESGKVWDDKIMDLCAFGQVRKQHASQVTENGRLGIDLCNKAVQIG